MPQAEVANLDRADAAHRQDQEGTGGQAKSRANAKPLPDLPDLFAVSTTTGQPLASPAGTPDLLESIVREHLQRAATAKAPARVAAPAAGVSEPVPDVSQATAVAEMEPAQPDLLERELETLLATAAPTAPHPPATPADRVPEAITPANAADAAPAAAQVTAAELDALLSAAATDLDMSPTVPAADDTPEPEQQVQEAEGVLREELMRLMGGEAGPAAARRTEQVPTPPPVLETPVVTISDTVSEPAAEMSPAATAEPQVAAAGHGTPAADVAPLSPSAAGSPVAAPSLVPAMPEAPASPVAPAAATSAPAAPAGMQFPPPVIIEAPEEDQEEEAPGKPSLRTRLVGLIQELLLMLAQLLDLPFAWISQADKHLIGLAAFILLLSGVALYIVAWMTGQLPGR